MITSLAQYIADFLLKNDIIISEKLDIYIYGFEIMISSIISILIGLLLGIAFSQLFECTLFLIVFILMRSYSGGYHANTYLKCNVIFAANIFIAMLVLRLNFVYTFYLHIIICAVCLALLIRFSPIKNKYKPLTYKECKKHKITSVIIEICFALISSVLCFKATKYSIVIDMALLSVAVSMIIEIIIKRRNYDEEMSPKSSRIDCQSRNAFRN